MAYAVMLMTRDDLILEKLSEWRPAGAGRLTLVDLALPRRPVLVAGVSFSVTVLCILVRPSPVIVSFCVCAELIKCVDKIVGARVRRSIQGRTSKA
jgi:hypothetical protein